MRSWNCSFHALDKLFKENVLSVVSLKFACLKLCKKSSCTWQTKVVINNLSQFVSRRWNLEAAGTKILLIKTYYEGHYTKSDLNSAILVRTLKNLCRYIVPHFEQGKLSLTKAFYQGLCSTTHTE